MHGHPKKQAIARRVLEEHYPAVSQNAPVAEHVQVTPDCRIADGGIRRGSGPCGTRAFRIVFGEGLEAKILGALLGHEVKRDSAHQQQKDWDAAVTAYQSILEHKNFCFDTDGAAAVWFDALRSIAPALEQVGRTGEAANYREEYLRHTRVSP